MTPKKITIILTSAIILTSILFIVSKRPLNNSINNSVDNKTIEPTIGTDVCSEFPKEFISSILNKNIIKTEDHQSKTTNTCAYYIDNNNFVTLRANSLNVQAQKDGQTALGRTITTDPSIKMEHFLVQQENGIINEIVLVLNPNSFIAVDRSSINTASEEELVKLATKISERILTGKNIITNGLQSTYKSTKPTPSPSDAIVPLPQGEDIVRNFFELIKEGKISDAVGMMSSKAIADDSQKQAWGVQFNAFENITVISTQMTSQNQYKVVLNVKMKPESANAPIPYYGFENGNNTRWVTLEKENGLFKIAGISTGP